MRIGLGTGIDDTFEMMLKGEAIGLDRKPYFTLIHGVLQTAREHTLRRLRFSSCRIIWRHEKDHEVLYPCFISLLLASVAPAQTASSSPSLTRPDPKNARFRASL